MNNLTTKVGDGGFTRSFTNKKISKGDISIEAMAWGDLLNVMIGRVSFNHKFIFPAKYSKTLQKAYSIIMGQISTGDLNSFEIDKNTLDLVERLCREYMEDLEEYTMSDWLVYDGNDAFLASKYARLFEVKFVQVFGGGDSIEYKFINRVSDMFFYLGVIIQQNH